MKTRTIQLKVNGRRRKVTDSRGRPMSGSELGRYVVRHPELVTESPQPTISGS